MKQLLLGAALVGIGTVIGAVSSYNTNATANAQFAPPSGQSGDALWHLPKFGVYATIVDVLDGPHKGRYQGAASLGDRPTFGDNDVPNLEVFLFDFKGDLYGATLSTALVAFLRPELAFDGMESLIIAMKEDCENAREILNAL